MFKKVLEYAGEYRRTIYVSMVVMLIGIAMNVLPFLFLYQLIEPLLLHGNVEVWYVVWRVLAIGSCGVLYALFYVKGLALSHRAAYKTLKNLRFSLQKKLERQPFGSMLSRYKTGMLCVNFFLKIRCFYFVTHQAFHLVL